MIITTCRGRPLDHPHPQLFTIPSIPPNNESYEVKGIKAENILRDMVEVGPAVRMRGVSRTFGEIQAVKGLSMEVPWGSVFGFLGPNGAGKTTTMRLLLGLLVPTAGSIQVMGLDPQRDGDAIRRSAGVLLDPVGLYDFLSVEDNLEFYGRVWKISRNERRKRSDDLLSRFGLADRRRDRVGTLSRGMKQKLGLARSLFHSPSLLFFDEPTTGLDPEAVTEVRALILEWARDRRATVFFTTHNLDEAQRMCDLIGVIRGGSLAAFGSPGLLRARGGAKYLRVIGSGFGVELAESLRGSHGITSVAVEPNEVKIHGGASMSTATIVRAIVEHGGEVEGVHEEGDRSLEEVYLDAMKAPR
jgi:ABC-2 type transport system ATP-binding protein